MIVGVITGSGTYALPGLEAGERELLHTPFGDAELTAGRIGDRDVLHLSRHGEGHRRLSNHVDHRSNIWALREAGAQALLAATVCGAVDPRVALGSLVVFDELHFPSNRLADGSACTLHTEPGAPGRGHWIFDSPFSEPLRQALVAGADSSGAEHVDGGCYGHVDGPRFNTRSEIRALACAGVTAVSQTAGPEAVLAGEARLPYALLGYATDHANGVMPEPTPVSELERLIAASTAAFAATLSAAVGLLSEPPPPTGSYFEL